MSSNNNGPTGPSGDIPKRRRIIATEEDDDDSTSGVANNTNNDDTQQEQQDNEADEPTSTTNDNNTTTERQRRQRERLEARAAERRRRRLLAEAEDLRQSARESYPGDEFYQGEFIIFLKCAHTTCVMSSLHSLYEKCTVAKRSKEICCAYIHDTVVVSKSFLF